MLAGQHTHHGKNGGANIRKFALYVWYQQLEFKKNNCLGSVKSSTNFYFFLNYYAVSLSLSKAVFFASRVRQAQADKLLKNGVLYLFF